jgi:dihydroneopterin aldolase
MTEIQLLLEGYVAQLRVGVLPHERAAPQRCRVNISVQLKKPPARDNIAETYDYTQIIAAVDALAATHVDLLESFAAALAEKLLSDKKLAAVDIELMKLDIFDNGRVGVRLQKRQSFCK